MNAFEPIEITPNFYQLGTPFFPVYLSLGEDAMIIEGGIGATLGFYSPEKDTFSPDYFVCLVEYCKSIRKLGNIPAKRIALSHNGVRGGDVRAFFRKALEETEAEHPDLSVEL